MVKALLVALLWGLQFVTVKVGLNSFPPLLYMGLRFVGVAVLIVPFVARPKRADLPLLIMISIFYGSLCFGLFFAGLARSQASIGSILAQLMAPFTILFAWPVLQERPTVMVVIGVLIAFAGAALALGGEASATSVGGVALMIAGVAAQGVGNVLVRRLRAMPPLRLLGWMAALGAPQLLIASALFEDGQLVTLRQAPIGAWASLIYAIVLGAITAFALWFRLLHELPLARVAPFALLQTVFGVSAGALFLGEPLTVSLVAGALLCLAGVGLTQIVALDRDAAAAE